ncbi:mandelate racemase/muconate lactonizing enzyme family protein [Salibacterium halotolerans]|uniref:D-galactarolactone cycloisomerase n=1 Tax=Salibacterium halotolerans TaxID=1884432 RepID=A0A1I5U6F5_9BACI|nr:mandelate racemase/muconate lactonizing enzyme family protein [Salibacterium halotolerans]SFP90868.1 D-galactarolactone cycloisomerase [Salibacterium halotolerans]
MKIVDVVPHILKTPLKKPFAFSQGWVQQRSTVITEIVTDEGVTGWGESLCHGLQPPEIAASFIQYCFKPLLIGQDPFDVEVLWEEMYNTSRPYGQAGAAVNAISGVDIAIWDVIGKSLNKPISKLIGGRFRNEIVPYATGFYRKEGTDNIEAGIEEAKSHLAKGFNAFKLKTGFGVEADLEYIHEIRKAVGNEPKIMLDANGAYNASLARRILIESEADNIHFFEEPLPPEDLEGYKQLKNLTKTYVAAGENIFGKIGYRHWIADNALDILQPDLCSSGGFTEGKKIAAMAQAYNTMLIPHVWGSGIGLAASMQYIASLPPAPLSLNPMEPYLEYDQSSHPFREDLIYDAVRMENGKVHIPEKPGIGVEVNRDVIDKYSVQVFQ